MRNLLKSVLIASVMIVGVQNVQAANTQSLVSGSINNAAHTYIQGWTFGGATPAAAVAECNSQSNNVVLPNMQAGYNGICKQIFTAAYGKALSSVWTQSCAPAIPADIPNYYWSRRYSNTKHTGLKITCVAP